MPELCCRRDIIKIIIISKYDPKVKAFACSRVASQIQQKVQRQQHFTVQTQGEASEKHVGM